jgi:hypothetical protein
MEALTRRRARFVKSTTFRRRCPSVFMSGKAAMIFARTEFRKRAANYLSERPVCFQVKGKRISCPPQYGYRDPAKRARRLTQRHAFEHCFPLIRSLRASVQRSTSVLFSFSFPAFNHIGGIFNNFQPVGGTVVEVTLDLANDELGWDVGPN